MSIYMQSSEDIYKSLETFETFSCPRCAQVALLNDMSTSGSSELQQIYLTWIDRCDLLGRKSEA